MGVGGSVPRPGRLYPLGKARYPLYRRLGGPQGQSGRAENLAPHRDSIPDRPARSQSLYRLSYPAHIWSNNRLEIQKGTPKKLPMPPFLSWQSLGGWLLETNPAGRSRSENWNNFTLLSVWRPILTWSSGDPYIVKIRGWKLLDFPSGWSLVRCWSALKRVHRTCRVDSWNSSGC